MKFSEKHSDGVGILMGGKITIGTLGGKCYQYYSRNIASRAKSFTCLYLLTSAFCHSPHSQFRLQQHPRLPNAISQNKHSIPRWTSAAITWQALSSSIARCCCRASSQYKKTTRKSGTNFEVNRKVFVRFHPRVLVADLSFLDFFGLCF
jgi:hypothetical protein